MVVLGGGGVLMSEVALQVPLQGYLAHKKQAQVRNSIVIHSQYHRPALPTPLHAGPHHTSSDSPREPPPETRDGNLAWDRWSLATIHEAEPDLNLARRAHPDEDAMREVDAPRGALSTRGFQVRITPPCIDPLGCGLLRCLDDAVANGVVRVALAGLHNQSSNVSTADAYLADPHQLSARGAGGRIQSARALQHGFE